MKIIFTAVSLFAVLFVQAQKKSPISIYTFDANWKSIDYDSSTYLAVVLKMSDTSYQWRTYKTWGALVSVESFRDEEANIPQGRYAWYDGNGTIDSTGILQNNLREGRWYYFNDKGETVRYIEYSHGEIIGADELGPSTNYSDDRSDPNNHSAIFKGGVNGWKKYLIKNIKYPERAQNNGIGGSVRVMFTVTKAGETLDHIISQSVEYSLDTEAIRIIKDSPNWQPGVKEGKIVSSLLIQPITFVY